MTPPASDPILSFAEAIALEERLFAGAEAAEWNAMERAGAAVAAAALRDFREIGGFPGAGRILILAGKGHNGGDALIAARHILEGFPSAHADVVFAFGERVLRPLAQRAWRELGQAGRGRVDAISAESIARGYDLCIGGIFGLQFRPPVTRAIATLIGRVNALSIRLRAAVDLPSGLGESWRPGQPAFRADFTYATGSVKRPVVADGSGACVGRLRYIDLGFFEGDSSRSEMRILSGEVLSALRALRSPVSDKRTYGHLLVVGGSRGYPGAVLMTVLSALRSGVGLVTAGVPASLAPAFAARAPEAMWIGLPETPEGGLAREGLRLLKSRLGRASALAFGPGMGREPETLALARDLAKEASVPLVVDADALQPEIVASGTAPRVLTPHAGEWERIRAAGGGPGRGTGWRRAVIVRKAPLTSISSGKTRYFSPFGGPVLARGGSGDILTGLIGGLLAREPADPLLAACRGVVWHGKAADALAQAQGQTAVRVTQLLEYLPQSLREG